MSSMSPTGLHLNKPAASLLIGVIIGGVVWFQMSGKSPALAASHDRAASPDRVASPNRAASPDRVMSPDPTASPQVAAIVEHIKSWKTSEATDIPSDKLFDLESDQVKKDKLKITIGDQPITVAYRNNKIDKSYLDVLLLHGAAYKSEIWVYKPLWTLQLLARMGYRGVAIDLPGYGDSAPASPSQAEYIEAVIAALGLQSPVIVSPSMSGSYALPYLFKDPVNVLSRSKGFVAVAPAGTDGYSAEQYKSLKIPTIMIYGENDIGPTRIGSTAKANLENLPNHVFVELKDAGHACYIDNPDDFHKHLIHFLQSLHVSQ